MQTDIRGVPVSTSNPQALDLFERALIQFQTYVGDPVDTIEEAIAHDPEFVLGHAFRATMLLLATERRYLSEARASVEAAEALATGANDRERGLTAAARSWLDGDLPGATQRWESVLVAHPRDAFARAHFLVQHFLGLRHRILPAI